MIITIVYIAFNSDYDRQDYGPCSEVLHAAPSHSDLPHDGQQNPRHS